TVDRWRRDGSVMPGERPEVRAARPAASKGLTQRTRRTTEHHGEAFPARNAVANPGFQLFLLHSVPTHMPAARSTPPWCSVVLRVLRVKSLFAAERAARSCGRGRRRLMLCDRA